MKEKRRHTRHKKSIPVTVKPDPGEPKKYTTHDVSDGGMFLLGLLSEQVPVGTTVVIEPVERVPGVMPRAIKARVVRSSAQGMGIEFINEDSEKKEGN